MTIHPKLVPKKFLEELHYRLPRYLHRQTHHVLEQPLGINAKVVLMLMMMATATFVYKYWSHAGAASSHRTKKELQHQHQQVAPDTIMFQPFENDTHMSQPEVIAVDEEVQRVPTWEPYKRRR